MLHFFVQGRGSTTLYRSGWVKVLTSPEALVVENTGLGRTKISAGFEGVGALKIKHQ